MDGKSTDERFRQRGKWFRSGQRQFHGLTRTTGEIGSLAFDRCILHRRCRGLDGPGWYSKITHQVVQERVVDDTQDSPFLMDEAE